MANLSKNISNTVNVFGGSPTSQWGQANFPYTMTWGTTKLGEGTFSTVFSVQKIITNLVVPDTTIAKTPSKFLLSTMVVSGDMNSETLANGIWNYIFIPNTPEGELRTYATWTTAAAAGGTFVCAAAATATTWT